MVRTRSVRGAALVAFVGATLLVAACGGSGGSSSGGVLRVANDEGLGSAATMDPYDGNRFWPAINKIGRAHV